MPPKRSSTKSPKRKSTTKSPKRKSTVKTSDVELQRKSTKSPRSPKVAPAPYEPIDDTILAVDTKKKKKSKSSKSKSNGEENGKKGLLCFIVSAVISFGALVAIGVVMSPNMGWLFGLGVGGFVAFLFMGIFLIGGRIIIGKDVCSTCRILSFVGLFLPGIVLFVITAGIRSICIEYQYEWTDLRDIDGDLSLSMTLNMTTDNPDMYKLSTDTAYITFSYTHDGADEVIDTYIIEDGIHIPVKGRYDFSEHIQFQGESESYAADCTASDNAGQSPKNALIRIYAEAFGIDFEMVSLSLALPCLATNAPAGGGFLTGDSSLTGGETGGSLGPLGGECTLPSGYIVGGYDLE